MSGLRVVTRTVVNKAMRINQKLKSKNYFFKKLPNMKAQY